MDGELMAANLNKSVGFQHGNDATNVFTKQAFQFGIADIAGGNQQQLLRTS